MKKDCLGSVQHVENKRKRCKYACPHRKSCHVYTENVNPGRNSFDSETTYIAVEMNSNELHNLIHFDECRIRDGKSES